MPSAVTGKPWILGDWLGLLLAGGVAALVLALFHDRFWLPHDEGAYAHVASRILAGDVLNRDVQDVHAGYVNFANAAALKCLGPSLRSLRAALVAMSFIQSCLVYLLLRPRGMLIATAGSVAMTCLSLVQFLNPTANWYALFFYVLVIAWLAWFPRRSCGRIEVVGFLLATIFLFRQLSGVIAAIGVIGYLLSETARAEQDRGPWSTRMLIGVMQMGLLGYLFTKTGLLAALMYGAWPLALLQWVKRRTGVSQRDLFKMCGRLSLGAVVAAAPLLVYHLRHGSLANWFQDTVVAAHGLTQLDFIQSLQYWMFVLTGARQALAGESVATVVNGLFWIVLPLLAVALGALAVRFVWAGKADEMPMHPLPFLAVFFALVSLHFQVSIYLFYSVGLTIAGLLWFVSERVVRRAAVAAGVGALCSVGLYFHAGQPITRGEWGILRGDRIGLVRGEQLDACGLWIERRDVGLYTHLIALVDREVLPDRAILALPVNPELYFLTGRPAAARFFNSALGIQTDAQLQRFLRDFEQTRPQLVFYQPSNLYNTAYSERVMQFVRERYELLETAGAFEVYRRRSEPDRGQIAAVAPGETR